MNVVVVPGIFIMAICGVLMLAIGLYLLILHDLRLLHKYHYRGVKKENRKIFAIKMGFGFLAMGITLSAGAVINGLTNTNYGWISFAVGTVLGIAYLFLVMKKYNGCIFAFENDDEE